jgi:hypothetical protein
MNHTTMTDTVKKESTVLAISGSAFLGLAGFFLWRDLDLPRELVMLATAIVTGLAATLRWPRRRPELAVASLLGTVAVAGAWYLETRSAGLLPSLAVTLVATVVGVLRGEGKQSGETLAERLSWYAMGAAILAATWAFYFHFLTLGVAAESTMRRLIPTLGWLVIGLAFFLLAKVRGAALTQNTVRRPSLATGHVGLALTAIALVKAIAYDTAHLAGIPRVLVMAAVGALLLVTARLMARVDRQSADRFSANQEHA